LLKGTASSRAETINREAYRSAEGQEWSPQRERSGYSRICRLTAQWYIRAKPLPSPVKPLKAVKTISNPLSTGIQITSGTEINRGKVRIAMPRFSTIETGQQKQAPAPAGASYLSTNHLLFNILQAPWSGFLGFLLFGNRIALEVQT
jgi:hypothetical protein